MVLPLTGERTVPGLPPENYWLRRHEVAYLAAAAHCAGRTVLDAGAGEGYGAAAGEIVAAQLAAPAGAPCPLAQTAQRHG